MTRSKLSKLRAEVGRKGAEARWGGHVERATACLRVYPDDAAEIKRRAKAAGRLPADEVAAMVAGAPRTRGDAEPKGVKN